MPEPYYQADDVALYLGDCLELLPQIDRQPRSLSDMVFPIRGPIAAIVTDPPYGLSFMGRRWDYDVPAVEIWRECLRAVPPGGHLLSFAGTRTQHRMAVNIEDAGFEIRDMIAWIYGSGFPKSLDVSKAIDKAAGADLALVGQWNMPGRGKRGKEQKYGLVNDSGEITAPATDAAKEWQGWGTALKPALEPITVARRPLDGSVADNVQAHRTGAINIDGCRVPFAGTADESEPKTKNRHSDFGSGKRTNAVFGADERARSDSGNYDPPGRWPANLVHDGGDEVMETFPQTGISKASMRGARSGNIYGDGKGPSGPDTYRGHTDKGSAARFFYHAKANADERAGGNDHPTIKPIELMRWLCRLITPAGGVVLDPFAGSGTTAVAAILDGFGVVAIEREESYCEIAAKRIEAAARGLSVADLDSGQGSLF